jgi:hypothetical protein
MVDVLLYTIYILLVLIVGLVVWSFVHQYTTHND